MTSAIFGLRGSDSSPCAVLDGSSVRTSQGFFLPREEKHGGVSSVTWPRSGTWANGRCYPLETSARLIVGKDSGSSLTWRTPSKSQPEVRPERLEPIEGGTLGGMNTHRDRHTGRVAQFGLPQQIALRENWPTPTVGDSKSAANATASRQPGSTHHAGVTLTDAIRTWPTPIRRDARTFKGAKRSPNAQGGEPLAVIVGLNAGADAANLGAAIQQTPLWPTPAGIGGADGHSSELGQAAKAGIPGKARVYQTPRASDGEKGGPNQSFGAGGTPPAAQVRQLANQVGGQLNPDWVEFLMGFPIGWTEAL